MEGSSINMNSTTLKAIARLTRIDPALAVRSKRHNPILDSEIHIEEELINLKESLDSYHAAGETLREYPKVHAYVAREKRAIMKHCLGLLIRMSRGRVMPRPYTRAEADDALRRFVRLVVDETHRTGRKLPDDILPALRPYLTMRQRVALRDFGMDMVLHIVNFHRAVGLASRLPILRSK
jgi:hypothetical protein